MTNSRSYWTDFSISQNPNLVPHGCHLNLLRFWALVLCTSMLRPCFQACFGMSWILFCLVSAKCYSTMWVCFMTLEYVIIIFGPQNKVRISICYSNIHFDIGKIWVELYSWRYSLKILFKVAPSWEIPALFTIFVLTLFTISVPTLVIICTGTIHYLFQCHFLLVF